MARIYVGGAGGAPSNGFIRSLRNSSRRDYLIGASSVPSDLLLALTDEKYVVPPAVSDRYEEVLLPLLEKLRPDFIHVQHDLEVRAVSALRDRIAALGIKLYLPAHDVVECCVNKYRSYLRWSESGIKVPRTFLIRNKEDLKNAFHSLGTPIWIRAVEGAGGRGALPTSDTEFARGWIDHFSGWGAFTASVLLTPRSVTWLSIWYQGKLVVAQQRTRKSWGFADRTLSGVSGITAVGETTADVQVDEVAMAAIQAIDPCPHGIFGVDITYDLEGVPNPTEINVGRFFTTQYFFTRAGLNMPEIYCNIAVDGKFPHLERKINPLPCGLLWIRGIDTEPVLANIGDLERLKHG